MFKDMSISNTIMEEFKENSVKSNNVSSINIIISYVAQAKGHILNNP